MVFDIQDAGARFYTYPATLGYLLEAAAQAEYRGDRAGPAEPDERFVCAGEHVTSWSSLALPTIILLPIRHGMTLGELAQLYNTERKIGARLRVIPMQGWLRGDWFDSTGIVWINTSPNLRSVNEAELYPGRGDG